MSIEQITESSPAASTGGAVVEAGVMLAVGLLALLAAAAYVVTLPLQLVVSVGRP